MKKIFGVSGYEVCNINDKTCVKVHCFGYTLTVSLTGDIKIIHGQGNINQSKENEILNWIITNKDFLISYS